MITIQYRTDSIDNSFGLTAKFHLTHLDSKFQTQGCRHLHLSPQLHPFKLVALLDHI